MHQQDLNVLRALAEQGDIAAQLELGAEYSTGEHVTLDFFEASRLFRLAADQGNETAQFFLGTMYLGGKGVPLDKLQGAYLISQVAEQGNPNAQGCLGIIYASGRGGTKDAVLAYKWLTLAKWHEASWNLIEIQFLKERLDQLSNILRPEQIAEGIRLAIEWNSQRRTIDLSKIAPAPGVRSLARLLMWGC
jgi:hypothetical protein